MKFSISAAFALVAALSSSVSAAPMADTGSGKFCSAPPSYRSSDFPKLTALAIAELEKRDPPMFTTVSTWSEWALLRTRFRFANIDCKAIRDRFDQMPQPEQNLQCWDATSDPNIGSWVFDVSVYDSGMGHYVLACAMADLQGGSLFCTPQACCGW